MWRRSILGAINRPFVAGGPTYDADAQAIFDEMTTPPDETRKGVIEDLVLALKADGIWSQCDAIYVLAAHDSQAARINWKVPGETLLAETVAPTFTTDRGYAGNGASQYLTGPTQWDAFSNFTQNNAHISIYNRTNTNTTDAGMIGAPTSAVVLLNPRNTSNQTRVRVNESSTFNAAVSVSDGSGFYLACRTGSGSAAENVYRNGSAIATGAGNGSTTRAAEAVTLLRSAGSYSNKEIAFASVGADLSSVQSEFYSAVAAYMTAVGA